MKYSSNKGAKRATAKKGSKGGRKAGTPYDGQKLILSSYAEINLSQDATDGQGGVMAYSLVCDPLDMKLKLASSTNSAISASDGVNAIASDTILSFPRFDQFKEIYRQYKIDWVKINLTTDQEFGLDNPVITLTNKGDPAAVTVVSKAMSQAHKEVILTESKRTMSYGWKPSTAMEKDYRMTHAAVQIGEQNVMKVLQDVEPKNGGNCKHCATITAGVTFKDQKSPN